MGRFDPILTNFNSGELSELLIGRVDIEKYANGVSTLENFYNMLQGGILRRPGSRYVASTKDDGIARIIPFQYSSDLDYVLEMGDEYFRLYSNGADLVEQSLDVTKLLLNNNTDVDGSLEFIDSGDTGHIVSTVGTAQTSSAQKKFGNASLLLDGNSDYLTAPDHADWNFGTGDFTIDCWIRFNTLTTGRYDICSQADASDNYWEFRIYYLATGSTVELRVEPGTTINIYAAYDNFVTDVWYHLMITRSGNDFRIFVNGTQIGSTQTNSNSMPDIASDLRIGVYKGSVTTYYFDGYIDEFRISKGIARETSDFTPETSAYTSDSYTKLLLHCNSQDASTNAHRIQFQGTAQLDTAVKKWGTGSLLLDGNSDYLQIPNSSDFDIVASSTDDWTVDFWVKHTDHAGTEQYMSQYEDSTNYWTIYHTDGSGIKFLVSSGSTIIDTGFGGEITDTDWHHIALCKVGSKYAIYKDGVQVNYTLDDSTDTFTGDLFIGAQGTPTNYFDGSMDDIRIMNYNVFNANPNSAKTDTIVIPTSEVNADPITQTEIETPYIEDDIFDIRSAHKGDVKYLTHEDYAPRILSRTDATTFSLGLVPFVRGPFLDDNTTSVTITPSAATGSGITLTASSDLFYSSHVGALWRVKDGVVKIVTYVSGTSVTADVQAEPDGTAGNLGTTSATTDWAEGAFSDYRGWPAVCAFHDGRLYYACTTHEPQKIWGSCSYDYNNFDEDDASDDDAVTFELATEERVAIRWMASGNKALTLGSTGGTYSAYGTGNGPITPTDIQINRDTNYGSSLLPAKRVSSFLYYVQRNLQKVRELSYYYDYDVTRASDMTLLAEHILRDGDGVVDWDYQQSPNDRLWCVRDDGQIALLSRNPEQNALGWGRIIAGADSISNGEYESVCVIPKANEDDQVWVVVKRTINGSTKRFIEYFTPEEFTDLWDAVCLDSSLTLDNPKTITGATKADPVVITATGHGFSNGDQVRIDNVEGMTELNEGEYLVANKTDDTFEITDLQGVDIDGTGYTAYISGGEVRKMVDSVSGLDHLEGETVQVQMDGGVPDTNSFTVSGGAITLPSKAAVVHAGLPYTPLMKTLRPEGGSQIGTAQGKVKRIPKMTVRFYKTLSCKIGTDDTQDSFTFDELFTGDKDLPLPIGWEKDSRIVCTSSKPLPLAIIALMPNLNTSDM